MTPATDASKESAPAGNDVAPAKDPVVPLQQSQQMVDAVNSSGGNAKLTVYPEADHDSWTETYNSDELYEWLLSQSK